MKLYIVDAFTDMVFNGNPAGVVILDEGADFPPPKLMMKTAAELRYSETAFVLPKGDFGFSLKYFTPTEEVDLCGHATIASFKALLDAELVKNGQTCMIDTLAGKLSISIQDGFVIMDMAKPEIVRTITDKSELTELANTMGLVDIDDISFCMDVDVGGKNQNITFCPAIVSTGLPDIILPVSNKYKMDAMKPNLKDLAALSRRWGVTGVHAFTLEGTNYVEANPSSINGYCRNFAPAVGIEEEAATGTSTGALTMYLYSLGMIKQGDTNIFIQGEAMNRPSEIRTYVEKADHMPLGQVNIRVGGTASIVAKGTINI